MRIGCAALVTTCVLAACSSGNNTTGPGCSVTAVAVTAPASIMQSFSATLTATVTPTNCTSVAVAWVSSNPAILTVDSTGTITGITVGGPVTITAAAGGKTGTASISVVKAPVANVVIEPDSGVVQVGDVFSFFAHTYASNGKEITGYPATWSTSSPNGGAATINTTGTALGLAVGGPIIVNAMAGDVIGTTKLFIVRGNRLMFYWNGMLAPTNFTPDPNFSSGHNGISGLTLSYAAPTGYTSFVNNYSRGPGETDIGFVTPYGTANGGTCATTSSNNGAATINCYDKTGTATQSQFDYVMLGSAALANRFAYAFVDDSAPTGSVVPASLARYSSSGRPITVTSPTTGTYVVTFARLGVSTVSMEPDAIMVGNAGSGNAQCQAGGWADADPDLNATVYCFTPTGVPRNATFNIALISRGAETGEFVGFVDANQPSATTTYTATNSAVADAIFVRYQVSVTRTGVGAYSVRMPYLGGRVDFQVAAVGATPRRCAMVNWFPDATGVTALVACADVNGVATDSRFELVGFQ